MFKTVWQGISFSVVVLLSASGVCARQESSPAQAGPNKILLDVVVTPKSGPLVSGLEQQDFTVLDNKTPQIIIAFQAVDGRQAPIEAILLIDAVNIGYQNVALQRQELDRFLRQDGGHLAYPTTLAILTDSGVQIQPAFSKEGNELSAALDENKIGLRDIRNSAGFYGAFERFQISLHGLQELARRESPRPGRKIVLWLSPGWPLLTGPAVELSLKQQQQTFDEIVNISTQLREARVTLYSIDPLGTGDIGSRTFYWESFVKGVSKPNQAGPGNLALQVLAVQSGGMALNSSNDIAAQLQKCIADSGAYYEMSFDPPISDRPNEYHQLEVRIGKPGLKARTRQGYYSQR